MKSYQNGGLYFTRKKVQVGEENKIYYLPVSKTQEAAWNTVGGNFAGVADVVSLDASIDSANTAIYTYAGNVHTYYYVSGEFIYKARTIYGDDPSTPEVESGRTEKDPIKMVAEATDATLLFTRGNYLYFYKSASTNLSRVNCTGTDETLYTFGAYDDTEEFVVSTMTQMEFNTDWYMPDFVGETLLYSNVKATDSVAYNYVYAVNMAGTNETGGMTAKELNAVTEKFEEVRDYMQNEVTDEAIKNAMTYVFVTGATAAYEDVKDLYSAYQQEEIEAFAERRLSTNASANDYTTLFKDGGVPFDRESYFVNLVGVRSAEDEEAYAEGVIASLEKPVEEEEDDSFPVWAIVLISVGGGLLVAAGVAIPIIIVCKKKAKARRDLEATRVRKRKAIDTTDDKTIDVYGDETTAETPAEETVAEVPADSEE